MNPLSRVPRALTAATAAGLMASALAGLSVAAPAHAAPTTVLKVVGTTDVSDSGLIQNVIEPDFEAAHPDIDLQYTAQGTGTAIASAKSGGYSALLVHAASLENQFVADGYSLEKYGRAAFWGDYVLVGPKSDPAHVLEDGLPSHDTAGAFEKVAAAGETEDGTPGTAAFISRGSTPGTTVQEHAIWKLTSGVPTCTISSTQGGGEAPVKTAADGTACDANEAARPYAPWYHVTLVGQADNIRRTSTCASSDGGNGDDCYTFTDRGTFKYLQDNGEAQNLTIVARDNAASAPGGKDLLVNSFHAYGVNPGAPFTTPGPHAVNAKAARTFLKFLTSKSEQTKIGQYLSEGLRPAFIPSAAPVVTVDAEPSSVPAGSPVTVSGSVKNAVPGTPVLNDVPVALYAQEKGGPRQQIDSGRTDDSGAFSFTATPSATTRYFVRTPAITKIEIPSLDPPFGDLLQSGLGRSSYVTVSSPS